MNPTNVYEETEKAFFQRIEDYDRESWKLHTFEAKSLLDRIDGSLSRLYDNGCLSIQAFRKFDRMISNRMTKLY